MKTLRWLIVLVAAAIVTYLLLSTSAARADRNTQVVTDPATAAMPVSSRGRATSCEALLDAPVNAKFLRRTKAGLHARH